MAIFYETESISCLQPLKRGPFAVGMQHACDHQGYVSGARYAPWRRPGSTSSFSPRSSSAWRQTRSAPTLRACSGCSRECMSTVMTLSGSPSGFDVCTYATCAQLRDNGVRPCAAGSGSNTSVGCPCNTILYVKHQGAPLVTGRVKVDAQVQQGRLAHLPADAVAVYQAVAVSRFALLCVGLGCPNGHGVCSSLPGSKIADYAHPKQVPYSPSWHYNGLFYVQLHAFFTVQPRKTAQKGLKWGKSGLGVPVLAPLGQRWVPKIEVGLGTVNSFLVSKDSGTSLKLVSRSTRGGAAPS